MNRATKAQQITALVVSEIYNCDSRAIPTKMVVEFAREHGAKSVLLQQKVTEMVRKHPRIEAKQVDHEKWYFYPRGAAIAIPMELKFSNLVSFKDHFSRDKIKKEKISKANGERYVEYTVHSDAGVLIGYYRSGGWEISGGWASYTAIG